jgi:hypothetical protein
MNTFEQHRQVAYYRAAFHDMPIAGPMDGAAYGEYLKSKGLGMIIGVVASIVTMGAAMPLLASTVLATQIAGGVMMAGGVLSGVGAVTGNKKLMKIGGIMSLAGGIGGLASNALNGAGVGGAFASGSGSEAVSTMANSFMDSASSVSGGMLYGDRVAGEAAANSAADFGKTGLSGDEAGIINKAMEGAPVAPEALSAEQASQNILEATAGEIAPAGQSTAAAGAVTNDAGAIKLAGEAGSATVSEAAGSGITPAAGEKTAAATAEYSGNGIRPPGDTGSSSNIKLGGSSTPPAAADNSTIFGVNKTEALKMGVGALEKAAAAAFTPDEEAKMDAMTDYYKANTTKLTTENEIQQYKLANAKKQVVMISANDPQMEQKVASAAAAGYPVAFIPAIAAGGVTPVAGGAQMG